MSLSGHYGGHPPGDGLTPRQRLEGRLKKLRWPSEQGMACCPAHQDRTPSLTLHERPDGVVLLHCFAGCATEDVLTAIGLEWKDLWPDDQAYYGSNGSRQAKGKLDYARVVMSVIAGDRAAGRPLTAFDLECEATARETLETAGEAVEAVVEPLPLPPTVSEFLALKFPPVEPILGPMTTNQLVIIHAPAGAGKTMLQLAIADAIGRGREFLGWQCDTPHNVLVVDGEMGADPMQKRLSDLSSKTVRIANLAGWGHELEPLNLATEAGQAVVSHWVERCGTRVLILDNLMSLAWVEGVSVNSDEFWTPVRRFLIRLRAQGLLVIVVDHSNATTGQIHGTKTKTWHADIVMRMSQMEQEESPSGLSQNLKPRPKFRLSWDKVRGGTEPDEKVVRLGAVGQDWHWQPAGEALRAVARQMKENGMSIREIAEEMGVSKSKVGRWCK